jgi:hypothetical protein
MVVNINVISPLRASDDSLSLNKMEVQVPKSATHLAVSPDLIFSLEGAQTSSS